MLWILLALAVVAATVAGAVMALRRARRADARAAAPGARVAELAPHSSDATEVVARLTVEVPDPDRPSAQRLAQALADRTFSTSDHVERVVVQDASGRHVSTVTRHPAPLPPAATTPNVTDVHRPGASGSRQRPTMHVAPHVDDAPPPTRPLADRLDLPAEVRARVRDADDAVDLVRTLLRAGGHTVRRDGNLLATADEAVIVVTGARDATERALGEAYLRFRRSGARRGIVVSTEYVDVAELRRRHALVPELDYVGADALQQMADAVAMGLDPIAMVHGVSA